MDTKIKVKSKYINKYVKGYPLILKDSVINIEDINEGAIISLLDERNNFIAKGYYGIQNKGIGWILSHKDEIIDKEFFKNKIKSALVNRNSFFKDKDTTAFRVFNGEGDGIGGFTIDYFDGYYLINWYSEGIYSLRKYIVESISELVDYKGIYQKKRFATDGKYIDEDDFVMGERGNFPVIVKENKVNFAIYLNEGAMVGVFLDQRDVRKKLRDHYVKGKTVLNTFSYTGAFSVFAAIGGAAKTTSVDLANRSLSKTIEQFSINDIDYEAQDIIVEDVFNYFKYAVKKELKFDTVILDPPSFARSKKFKFSAEKDYINLLIEAIQITEDDGVIVASINCSKFNMNKFKSFIHKAFIETKYTYKIIEEFSLPSDFKINPEYKEGNYLKVVFIKKVTN